MGQLPATSFQLPEVQLLAEALTLEAGSRKLK